MTTTKENLETIKQNIIDQIAFNMKMYGVSETVGRVMATIYYYKKPITLDILSEEMGMSKMSMSNAVRELMSMGIAEKVFIKNSRKDYYVVEQDYYQFFIDLFCSNWQSTIHNKKTKRLKSSQELEKILFDDDVDEETTEEAKKLLEENQRAIEFFDWIGRLTEHFESHEIFKDVPKTHNKQVDTD